MNPLVSPLNAFSFSFLSFIGNMAWQSSLFILLVSLASLLLLHKASPRFKYLLWSLVLVRLVLPPQFYLPTGIGRWGGNALERLNSSRVVPLPEIKPFHPAPLSPSPSFPAARVEEDKPPAEPLRGSSLLFLLWISGVALLLAWMIYKHIRFRNVIKSSSPPPQDLLLKIHSCSQKMGLRQKYRVRVSRNLFCPIVLGIFKPMILLPEILNRDLDDGEMESVIVHELAHIKRYDLWVNFIQGILGIVYFFHPLVWYANKRIRIEREKACDDLVLLTLGIPARGYAQGLVKVLDGYPSRPLFQLGFLGILEPKSDIGRRILRIMDKTIVRHRNLSLVSLLVLVLFGMCFLSYSTKPSPNSPAGSVITQTPLPPRIVGETFDEIYPQLSQEMKDKLETPVTLVFKSCLPDTVFQSISKNTGVKFITYGLKGRIDLNFQDVPASKALHLLSQGQQWKWELDGDLIMVYPGPAGRNEQKQKDFDEFLSGLSEDIRAKLDSPVRLIFSNARLDMVFTRISQQAGIPILSFGMKERADMVFQDVPAVSVLRILSKDRDWIWEKEGQVLFIYPGSVDRTCWEKIDQFFSGLSGPVREQLDKPVTLVFSNSEASMILEQLGKQTGVKFISQGIPDRIDIICQGVPGTTILRRLCKGYGWNPDFQDGVIMITPVKRRNPETNETKE